MPAKLRIAPSGLDTEYHINEKGVKGVLALTGTHLFIVMPHTYRRFCHIGV